MVTAKCTGTQDQKRVTPDHTRTLILTLNLTLTLSLNSKALTLNPISNAIWCDSVDPSDPVSLYVLQ